MHVRGITRPRPSARRWSRVPVPSPLTPTCSRLGRPCHQLPLLRVADEPRLIMRAPDGTVPAPEFLDDCPGTIDAQFTAVLDAVAAAPPPRFSGEGKWEGHARHDGWLVRDPPDRTWA